MWRKKGSLTYRLDQVDRIGTSWTRSFLCIEGPGPCGGRSDHRTEDGTDPACFCRRSCIIRWTRVWRIELECVEQACVDGWGLCHTLNKSVKDWTRVCWRRELCHTLNKSVKDWTRVCCRRELCHTLNKSVKDWTRVCWRRGLCHTLNKSVKDWTSVFLPEGVESYVGQECEELNLRVSAGGVGSYVEQECEGLN